jgi:hypothetical protein
VLGLLFLAGAVSKLVDFPEAVKIAQETYRLKSSFVPVFVGVVILVETFLGLQLLLIQLSKFVRYAVLFISFVCLVVHCTLIAVAPNMDCGCLGLRRGELAPIEGVFLAGGMALLSAYLVLGQSKISGTIE